MTKEKDMHSTVGRPRALSDSEVGRDHGVSAGIIAHIIRTGGN
jgi:hypothetical protein